ncbi:MAG: hypothetical protein ACTHN5_09710 [Phycisphaerae bacterium]
MSESEHDRPARNMADIARMFLDGARPGGGSAPKRVGPAERAAAAAPSPRQAPGPVRGVGTTWELAPIMLGVCGGNARDAWRMLSRMATGMAEAHATTICLLGVRDGKFVIEVAGSESAEDLPRVTTAGGGGATGSADMQVARVLYTLRESVGHWLIIAPETREESFAPVGRAVSQWVLACDASNEGVVAAYQQLKRAVMRATPVLPPRCYMLSEDVAEASLVHGRLRTAAGEFLKQELPLAGAGNGSGECNRVAAIAVGDAEQERIWMAVLDELCGATVEDEEVVEEGEPVAAAVGTSNVMQAHPADVEAALEQMARATDEVSTQSHQVGMVFDQLAHVLDPEERAALGADFGDEDVDVESPAIQAAAATPAVMPAPEVRRPVIADIRKEVIPPVAPVTAAAPVKPVMPPVEEKAQGVTLRAFDLVEEEGSGRDAQWLAVERSIKDLVSGSVVLDARPPMSWASDCCLSIDGDGGLHVWTLYKDGVSWFALREWAAEHRNILGLTRRDLVMAREGEVTVHIVLPLEGDAESSGQVKSLLRTPTRNVFIYRLRSVQWNGRRGILVVPIA